MASRWQAPAAGHAWIMGVLNCTPDSFSDGGLFERLDAQLSHARKLIADGAAIIDVGGESTRPGARPVDADEEMRRVLPVIRALSAEGIAVSIDTCKAVVMRAAIDAGACMVNDVRALADAGALEAAAEGGVDVCLMHMRGTPQSMQQQVQYSDVADEVIAFLEARANACIAAGIPAGRILLDPGIGFGKRLRDNLDLIAAIPRLKRLGFPVLMGVSRKRFLGELSGADVADREVETASAVTACILAGADVLRVHDVAAQLRAVRVASALRVAFSAVSRDV